MLRMWTLFIICVIVISIGTDIFKMHLEFFHNSLEVSKNFTNLYCIGPIGFK